MAKWYEGRIVDIVQMTESTRQFFVRIESEEVFDFVSGQFITIDLPIGAKRLQRWRSYSIASAPDGSNIIELCIVKATDGLGTAYLFNEITIGSVLKFKGPDGSFTMPKDLDQEIVMICTGTGLAPFRSMLCHIRRLEMPFRKIHLIFGTRYSTGILYHEELDKMTISHPNFTYDVALSREYASQYHHGYVHDLYKEKYKNVSGERQFYICGWSQMIDEAVANLSVEMGYQKSQIHFELYG